MRCAGIAADLDAARRRLEDLKRSASRTARPDDGCRVFAFGDDDADASARLPAPSRATWSRRRRARTACRWTASDAGPSFGGYENVQRHRAPAARAVREGAAAQPKRARARGFCRFQTRGSTAARGKISSFSTRRRGTEATPATPPRKKNPRREEGGRPERGRARDRERGGGGPGARRARRRSPPPPPPPSPPPPPPRTAAIAAQTPPRRAARAARFPAARTR